MSQLLQIVGALLVLGGFAGAQLGRLDQKSVLYLLLNVVGAGLLAVLAALGRDWGFLLLEGVWAAVAAVALAGVLAGRRRARRIR
jgi:hypothetical protein